MRRLSKNRLARAGIVAAVVAVLILGFLVKPLSEYGDGGLGPTATSTASATPTLLPSPTPTVNLAVLPGRVEAGVYWSDTTGSDETYLIYLPPGYDAGDARYPVLYLLHGWGWRDGESWYDESHWDDLGVDEAAEAGIQEGSLPPFIIVLPGADPDGIYVTSAGGDGSFEDQVVLDLIPHVDETYRTWATADGRAIGGISRGGVWSLEIGFRRSDLFATVGAHSVALDVNEAPPAYDPHLLVDEPGVGSLRIYLDAGDTDWALDATRQLHEDLDQRGIAHTYVVHTGGHEDGLWAENVLEYLEFYAGDWRGGGIVQ